MERSNMKRPRDFSNQQVGFLTVKEIDPSKPRGAGKNVYWLCECVCGNIISVNSCNLNTMIKKNRKSSCGCYTGYDDLTGQRFGKLVVIKPHDSINESRRWLCLCDCGCETIVFGSNLKRNHTQSCGCISGSIGEENISNLLLKHNISFAREYTFDELIGDVGTKLRFDFAIIDENQQIVRLIEYDGRQHFHSYQPWGGTDTLEDRQYRDGLKDFFAVKHNIPLVRIPYTKRDNITLEDIFSDKFLVKGERQ